MIEAKVCFNLSDDVVYKTPYIEKTEGNKRKISCGFPVFEFTGWVSEESKEKIVEILNNNFNPKLGVNTPEQKGS